MAKHRHKREPRLLTLVRPRAAVVAAPLAVLATTGAVSLGVMGTELAAAPAITYAGPVAGTDTAAATEAAGEVRRQLSRGGLSREGAGESASGEAEGPRTVRRDRSSAGRRVLTPADAVPAVLERVLDPVATREAIAGADRTLFTTAALNLWTEPGEAAELAGEAPEAEEVTVTGRELYGRVEIVWEGESRWVTSGYLSEDEPGVIGGECTNGTSVADGVSPNIVAVHQAICALFPEITSYGTFRSDGEHSQGIAIDAMVSGDRGQQVADLVRENAAELGVNYVIYAQRIWSVDRSSEGWRAMEDRGSVTANHYDHVHVTTY